MKTILLAGNENLEALVDDIDHDRLRAWKWWPLVTTTGKIYAYRPVSRDGHDTTVLMHRELMDSPKRLLVDHIDGNGLNNQRGNLRTASGTQNNGNRIKLKGTSSQYKGVSWSKSKKKWVAAIKCDGKTKFLGYFADEDEAARKYDVEALKVFGEFARPNFKGN